MVEKKKRRILPGEDPGFLLGGGALVSCSTSTPKNHTYIFFLQVISGGGGAHPLHPPPRSAPGTGQNLITKTITSILPPHIYGTPLTLELKIAHSSTDHG